MPTSSAGQVTPCGKCSWTTLAGGEQRREGGEARQEEFREPVVSHDGSSFEILDLHEALDRLSDVNQRKAAIAELFLFAGLTLDEVAQTLGCGIATVKREWALTKAWLSVQLRE